MAGRTFETIAVDDTAPQDDVENAFNDWRDNLGDSEAPGMLRAWRIPLDEHGKASYSSTGQVRLGSWPIDQYTFDALCSKLIKDYMLVNEQIMAVRLIGTLESKKGVRFNKIVMLQRPNATNLLPSSGGSQPGGISDVLKSMQDGQERMMRMFHEMSGGNKGGGESTSEMMKFAAMMRVMMEPMTTMMGPMLAALAGRPLPTQGPSSGIKETMETMVLIDKFMGRRGDRGGGRSDIAEIASAVSGVAKPVLEMAAANMQANLRTRNARQSVTVPQANSPQNTPAQTTPQAVPQTIQQAPPQAPVVSSGVDLSRPTATPVSPFAPGADSNAPSDTFIGDSDMFTETKKQVDALVLVAQEGADPVAVANQFFEDVLMELDDKNYGRLCLALESESYLERIAAYNPQAKQYPDWFAKLRARLVEHIVAADTPPKET